MKSEASVTAYNRVRRAINRSYRVLRRSGGWRAVGRAFGISGGMAYRIGVEGYEPADREIRLTLGLPVTMEVPMCPVCGKPVLGKWHVHRRSGKALEEMSEDEIRYALEHREVVE